MSTTEWKAYYPALLRSTQPINRAAAKAAVEAFYHCMDLDKPKIEFWQGPKAMYDAIDQSLPNVMPNAQDWLESKPLFQQNHRDLMEMMPLSIFDSGNLITIPGIQMISSRVALVLYSLETVQPESYVTDYPFLREILENSEAICLQKTVCHICDRPYRLDYNAAERLHSLDRAALAFRNGEDYHFVTGVIIPPDVFQKRDELSSERILSVFNLEKRRALIELMGREKFLKDADAVCVDQSSAGTLWRINRGRTDQLVFESIFHAIAANVLRQEEDIVFVEVENATIEHGQRRRFMLRVPPDMATAAEAVAWTFGKTVDEYQLTGAA